MDSDTISAIATANGIGSIAIIRISGDRALEIAQKLTHKEKLSPRYATLTNVYNQENTLIDEAEIKTLNDFAYFANSSNLRSDIFTVDKYLKIQGYMLSASERELLKSSPTLIVGRKFIINRNEKFVFIIPFTQEKTEMEKKFKEECRVLKIEPKLRGYLFNNSEIFYKVKDLLIDI